MFNKQQDHLQLPSKALHILNTEDEYVVTREEKDVKSTTWDDFHKQSNVIRRTARFQSVLQFSKAFLEFSEAAPEHRFSLLHQKQVLRLLPENHSQNHWKTQDEP